MPQRHAEGRVLLRGPPGRVPRPRRARDDHADTRPERGVPGTSPAGSASAVRARVRTAATHGSRPASRRCPAWSPFIYAEITREGRDPEFILIEEGVPVGRSHRIAVLEVSGRPGWWRIWVDGRAMTAPVRMRGSSGRWAPIATAESWNAGTSACNAFGFRFERVSVSYGGGGSWRPFVSGHRFLDSTHALRDLAAAPAAVGCVSPLARE